MSRQKKDIPPTLITWGEHAQVLDDHLLTRYPYRLGRWIFNGSDSPSFEWARYYRIQHMVAKGDLEWLIGPPDPEAGITNHSKKHAVVAGVGSQAMHELREELKREGIRVRDALAYQYRGIQQAGILPRGFAVEAVPETPGQYRYIGAMRTGREPIEMLPGVFDVETRTFYTAEGAHIVGDPSKLLDARIELPRRHPTVTLI